ncbi:MAG: hypothetical protein ACI82A_002247 [Candidatus Azotimanducaceae bacterium]|jgi:hypothetical protein
MSLDISMRVSFFQLSLITILLGLTLAALWLSSVPLVMQFAASLAVMISGYDWLCRAFLVQARGIIQLQSQAGDWWLTLVDGRTRKVCLTGPQIVLPWLVSLGFTDGRDQFGCAIFWDALTATQHRQLRAMVVLQPPPESKFRLFKSYLAKSSLSKSCLSKPCLSKPRWYQYCIDRLGQL